MKDRPQYKYCFVDVETNGIDRKVHNIHQLSAVITDSNLNELEKIDLKFCPFDVQRSDPEALKLGKVTLDELMTRPMSATQAYGLFVEFLSRHCDKFDKADKMHFVGYNAQFDADFVREFFHKNNDEFFGSWFWVPALCVMQAAAWYVQSIRGALPNFKLNTVCKCAELGWDDSQSHDASYDIRKTIELYRYLRDLSPIA